jgi:cytochrome c oxidase subunit 2
MVAGRKMRLRTLAAAAALLGAIATWAVRAQNTPAGPVTEIQMTAKKYEFDPSTVHVHVGDHVKLVITALDHTHGIKIEALHINTKLEKGDPVAVEFTAMQPGTYPFECSHFCGLGHGKMKGQLIIE